MKKMFVNKSLIIGIIVLISNIMSPFLTANDISQKDVLISFTIYNKSDVVNSEIKLSSDEALFIYDSFEKIRCEITNHPFNDETENLKSRFIELLDDKGLLPGDISKDEVIELLDPPYIHKLMQNKLLTNFLLPKISSTEGSSFFCSIASGGDGKTSPIIIGPRPHALVLWKGTEEYLGVTTSVGGLNSGKGFIAYGNQYGTAFGFEGVGLTYATPVGTVYGLAGYAIYVSVTADYIDFYPPNNKPEISTPVPWNNQVNIPVTLKELSFQINDDDNDLLDYSVTTDPFIGSDSKNNVGNGIYRISVDGLQHSTTYTWTVNVTDGKDTTTNIFSFTTAMQRPIITNPIPADESSTTTDLSELSFTLTDAQGDKMDYTVQTSPNVGSSSATGVGNGTYSIQISKLKENIWYYWYVNVTDGEHWTKEKFRFYTGGLGLVCYWSFDEGTGNILYDQTDYNNDGTIYGATWVSGIQGYALKFTSNDDIVSGIPSSWDNNIGNVFTISCWIKWDGPTSRLNYIIFDGRDDSWDMAGFILLIDNTDKLFMHWSESGSYVVSNSNIPVGVWTHVAIVFDGNSDSFNIYINNILDKTISTTATYRDSGHSAAIGNNHWMDGNWRPFNGIIDELRIYNQAVDQNDINRLYTFEN